jgi:hypothetical protein
LILGDNLEILKNIAETVDLTWCEGVDNDGFENGEMVKVKVNGEMEVV